MFVHRCYALPNLWVDSEPAYKIKGANPGGWGYSFLPKISTHPPNKYMLSSTQK